MFLLQCQGCRSTTTVQCSCPPEMADLPFHHPECAMTDPDAALECAPGSGDCCTDDHGGISHGMAANACPGVAAAANAKTPITHPGEPCPAPSACGGWQGMVRDVAALNLDNPLHVQVRQQLENLYGKPIEGDCPGGHCGKGVNGCTVCRPLTIQLLPGYTTIRPAGVK